MRVLVTGGAGFIGSNVARLLCDAGFEVRVLDDLSFGFAELLDPRCHFFRASLGDQAQLRAAMRGVEVVMHFAASSIIARSFTDPLEYVQNNIMHGALLLEAMREAGARQLIFSSSASVYGEPRRIPVQEDDPKQPLQIYGASKLAFEGLLQGYYHAFGIHSVALRYFNAYGPGDLQEPVTRAVPRWVRAALTSQPIITYWGGQQYRDYVFVEDIARAHLQVIGLEGARVYNLGTGSGVLMRDIITELEVLLGRPLAVADAGGRPGDPMRLVADVAKIRAEVGWRAQTELRAGLARTIRFFTEQRALWDRPVAVG